MGTGGGVGRYRSRDAHPRPIVLIALIPVVGGLVASLCWASSSLLASRVSRTVTPWATLAWISIFGSLLAMPLLLTGPLPGPDDLREVAWLVASSLFSLAGLLTLYAAFRRGRVGLIAPITSTEGAIAAVIAMAFGAVVSGLVVVALAVVVVGVVLTTVGQGIRLRDVLAGRGYVPLAVAAAVFFGVSLYAAGVVSGDVPLAWLSAAPRLTGAVVIAFPLLLLGRLGVPRRVLPYLLGAGAVEVIGIAAFGWGAAQGIAVAAVLASQVGLFVALISHPLGERLSRRQWAGVVIAGAGVAAVTVLSV